jgi:hypothetical protein
LARSLAEPSLRARAFVTGGTRAPRLVLSLSLPADRLEAISTATRELLERLSRGEIPDAALSLATQRAASSARERLGHPRARLMRLYTGAAASAERAPTLSELRNFASKRLVPSMGSVLSVRPE